jgi:hypothetical protein
MMTVPGTVYMVTLQLRCCDCRVHVRSSNWWDLLDLSVSVCLSHPCPSPRVPLHQLAVSGGRGEGYRIPFRSGRGGCRVGYR